MWVCSHCHHYNENQCDTCISCQTKRQEEEAPKGRKEHRHASYIKDKKTMYTHPGSYGWRLAHTTDAESEEQIYSRKEDYKVVAVLDLGTCFSGYGYSLRSDPTIYRFARVPTCLLVSSAEKVLGFGFEAIDKYKELEKTGQHSDCYFFQTFKTDLSEKENISLDMMVQDISGKELEAMKVFAFTLLALKKYLLALLKRDGIDVRHDEIRWVLPVPTTWNDAAKQFIRKLAEIIDIPEDQLLLSLEAEAASLAPEVSHDLKSGTKYMIVSLGGGITDVIVHEKTPNNGVKELVRARGGDFGGNSVNQKFLKDIVGEKVMTEFKQSDPSAYLSLFQEFEKAKTNINNNAVRTDITIPRTELEAKCIEFLGKNLLSVVKDSQFHQSIELYNNKISIDNHLLKGLIKFPINKTISTMSEVFQDPETSNVSHIILVGGSAASEIIQDAIRSKFRDKTLVVSEDPSSSAIKGSLSYGHEPGAVQSRVMKYSYGVGISDDFDPSKHDSAHCHVLQDGSKLAIHIFDTIVKKNQNVQPGSVMESDYLTIERNQKSMEFELYYSTNENPAYIDEVGSRSLGSVVLPFPEVSKEEREVKVSFVIGNTEIELRAVDKISGQKISVEFDLV